MSEQINRETALNDQTGADPNIPFSHSQGRCLSSRLWRFRSLVCPIRCYIGAFGYALAATNVGLPLALMFIPAILRSHRLVIANGQLDWRRPYASTLHIPLSSIGQIGIREKTIYYGRSSKPRKVKVLDILKEDGLVIATLDCKFSVPMDEIAKLLNERSQDCTP